jgi:hypothetical protein
MQDLSSNELLKFGVKLYQSRMYGASLLVVHGISFGLKVGKQLNIKWGDIIDKNGKPLKVLKIDNKVIPINETCQDFNKKVYAILKNKITLNDYVYTSKQGTIYNTSNLSKNLKRYAKDIFGIDYSTLTTSSLERAWALSIVERNHYSKDSFIAVCEYMGKRSMKETIEFLGCEPIKRNEITFGFDYIDSLKLNLDYI